MTFKTDDRVRETSTTVGAGTYTLSGNPTGFQPVSSIGANNYGPFFITDGTGWESIIGRYLAGPDRLERTHVLNSSNADAAVVWGAGTRTIRCGPIATLSIPRALSKAVGGGAGTTVLTQLEQRSMFIELTGALTGDRVIEVDDTPWGWPVLNNTTGAFKVTFRTTGQAGIVLQRGRRVLAYCDGVDVRHGENVVQRKAADVASAATLVLNVDGDLVDVTGNTGITAVTLEEGRSVTVRFTGTPTITHGASLVLPGAANIVAAAGDFAEFEGYAAGVVRVSHYIRAATGATPTKQPTTTVLGSGSGTYTTPANVTRIEPEMAGGGGGGGGSGSGATSGGNGGNTTFSTLAANGGAGGVTGGAGGTGGTATGGSILLTGGGGGGAGNLANSAGGTGGASFFGGFGQAGSGGAIAASTAGIANTGGGGGGAGQATNASAGAGGGAGGYCKGSIASPAVTYAYAVGAAGTAGAAGTGGAAGAAGGSGIIIVREYYD